MSNKTKVVDLVMGADGAYSERGTSTSKQSPKKVTANRKNAEQFRNNSDKDAVLPTDVDDFFKGLDSGLDFVEGVRSRVGRFMNLCD